MRSDVWRMWHRTVGKDMMVLVWDLQCSLSTGTSDTLRHTLSETPSESAVRTDCLQPPPTSLSNPVQWFNADLQYRYAEWSIIHWVMDSCIHSGWGDEDEGGRGWGRERGGTEGWGGWKIECYFTVTLMKRSSVTYVSLINKPTTQILLIIH